MRGKASSSEPEPESGPRSDAERLLAILVAHREANGRSDGRQFADEVRRRLIERNGRSSNGNLPRTEAAWLFLGAALPLLDDGSVTQLRALAARKADPDPAAIQAAELATALIRELQLTEAIT